MLALVYPRVMLATKGPWIVCHSLRSSAYNVDHRVNVALLAFFCFCSRFRGGIFNATSFWSVQNYHVNCTVGDLCGHICSVRFTFTQYNSTEYSKPLVCILSPLPFRLLMAFMRLVGSFVLGHFSHGVVHFAFI
eukprot:260743-Amphidinium_carterae.1